MGRIYEATWGRGFAALYDWLMRNTEAEGLREIRREVLREASGRTIDIGAGTGANLDLYPEAVDEIVLAEPSPHMAKRLRAKLEDSGRRGEVVEAPAERLPFADASFDTAVFTLVLCTVSNPEGALAEAARLLRPGGRMLFIEHVRSEEPRVARWQDRLERPWGFIGAGCHPNRDTIGAIELSPLRLESHERGQLPKAPPLVRPLVHGSAVRPG